MKTNGRRYGKRRTGSWSLAWLLVAGACAVVTTRPAFSGEGRPVSCRQMPAGSDTSGPQPPGENPATVPGSTSGMTIYIDPKTGAFLKEPAPGYVPLKISPQLQKALSTSHEGLVESPSSVPGGGVKLDLQGRFQSPLFVTIDCDGKVKMRHLHELPASGDKK